MKTNAVMSMVNPSTDALMTKVDSRYGLVVLAARRARQLMTGAELRATNLSIKSVTNALEEIAEGKIKLMICLLHSFNLINTVFIWLSNLFKRCS